MHKTPEVAKSSWWIHLRGAEAAEGHHRLSFGWDPVRVRIECI